MKDLVILVDENDNPLGNIVKAEAHLKGLLHRAFSIFIFNGEGKLLLQKRAQTKYHSGGLWTNTCCGHPSPGEIISDAANRRLYEEMKIKTRLSSVCSFKYKADLNNGLIEHEIDHVFYGLTDQVSEPDPLEAEDWKYIDPINLVSDINKQPEIYTAWLKICIDRKIFDELIKRIFRS